MFHNWYTDLMLMYPLNLILSNVVDATYMFNGANIFNKPLNNWDVSRVDYF